MEAVKGDFKRRITKIEADLKAELSIIQPKVLPEFSDNKYYMDKTDSVMK